MRAATSLVSLLQRAGSAPVWRAGELQAAEAGACVASGFAALDHELPGNGWPQGQLIELLLDDAGIGELSLLAPAVARIASEQRTCVWVLPCGSAGASRASSPSLRDESLPYAPALDAAGIDPAHSIFVKPATPRESLWACEQSLRAAHLGALMGWLPAGNADADFRALRRLHLLAARQRALVFVLRPTRAAHAPSPAALRLQLEPHEQRLHVTLLKRRGRPLLDPVVIDVYPPHWGEARVPSVQPLPSETQAAPARKTLAEVALAAQRWSAKAFFSH